MKKIRSIKPGFDILTCDICDYSIVGPVLSFKGWGYCPSCGNVLEYKQKKGSKKK